MWTWKKNEKKRDLFRSQSGSLFFFKYQHKQHHCVGASSGGQPSRGPRNNSKSQILKNSWKIIHFDHFKNKLNTDYINLKMGNNFVESGIQGYSVPAPDRWPISVPQPQLFQQDPGRPLLPTVRQPWCSFRTGLFSGVLNGSHFFSLCFPLFYWFIGGTVTLIQALES